MNHTVTDVPARTRLRVTYSFHPADQPVSDAVIVMHHGICHTRGHFLPLIGEVNRLGYHVAMIEQQSGPAGFFRNAIGARQYREAMAAAVRKIEKDLGRLIACYAVHSMGAMICEEMQQHHPDLAAPTVLMAPIPVRGALPITLRILARRPIDYARCVLTLNVQSLMRTEKDVKRLFFDDKAHHEVVKATMHQLVHAPFWMYCQLVLRFMREPIGDMGLPRLLLWSRTDEIFHVAQYKRTRSLYRKLAEAHLEGGHDFFVMHPTPAAQAIVEFTDRCLSATSAGERHIRAPHFHQTPTEKPAPTDHQRTPMQAHTDPSRRRVAWRNLRARWPFRMAQRWIRHVWLR